MISRNEAQDVLAAYSVGNLQFVRPGAGTANPAVVAVTTKGQFFLKRRNPRYSSKQRLSYDHAVIRHLAAAGLPVTEPIRTRAGSRWERIEETVYELYPLIEGREHTLGDPAQVAAAGELLARFHQATEHLKPPGNKPAPRLHDPAATLNGLQWAHEQLGAGAQSAHGDAGLVDDLMGVARGIRRRLPDKAYWELPQCIIHGDYHPANLKFNGSQVAGLFDFDWAGQGPRMVDVADGLLFFCGVRKEPLDPGDIVLLTQAFTLDEDLIRAFGKGYGALIEPSGAELAALPDLMCARWLFCRVDAMQRKIPDKQKLDYLLNEIGTPLAEIDRLQDLIARGEWLQASS